MAAMDWGQVATCEGLRVRVTSGSLHRCLRGANVFYRVYVFWLANEQSWCS